MTQIKQFDQSEYEFQIPYIRVSIYEKEKF